FYMAINKNSEVEKLKSEKNALIDSYLISLMSYIGNGYSVTSKDMRDIGTHIINIGFEMQKIESEIELYDKALDFESNMVS
ncbi:MAG: hypothetical protein ACLR3R_18795, partial [Clostridium paraputrificum]